MKDNRFLVEVSIPFPSGTEGQRVEQWLNMQHAGKPQIPLDEEVSEAHRQSHHNLHMSRRAEVLVEVDEGGNWKLLEIRG